jgi:hypothetical protein
MAFYCLNMDMQMTRMMNKWRLSASFFLLFSSLLTAEEPAGAPTLAFTPFEASYNVLRSGKKHGEAKRHLKKTEQGYELAYSSDISWLIFEDKRSEQSFFTIQQGRVQPSRYLMQRTGSGPNRYYELNLNWDRKELRVEKAKKLKTVQWNEQWLDPLSYHSQLALDLQAGKTEFVYQVLNRHGEERQYSYKVAGEEWLSLPYGKVKTIRIERTGTGADKKVLAWVAPELDYLLVRLWQAEDKVEQFDIQLASFKSMEP